MSPIRFDGSGASGFEFDQQLAPESALAAMLLKATMLHRADVRTSRFVDQLIALLCKQRQRKATYHGTGQESSWLTVSAQVAYSSPVDDVSAGGVDMRSEASSATVSDLALRPPARPSRIKPEAEAEALALLRDGRSQEAFKLLMVTYGEGLLAFIIRILRNREAARDVRQQVFLEAFQGIERFEGRSSLWKWLCSIAWHRSIDELNRNKRVEMVDFKVWDALGAQLDPSTDGWLVPARRALEQCLAALPDHIRTQLLMRLFLELSYAEIGEAFEEAHSTVQVRLSRVLPRVRKCLREKGLAR